MTNTGLPELRAALEAAGWRMARKHNPSAIDQCRWYAWKPDRTELSPDCASNHKPPVLCVYPSEVRVNASEICRSVEVEVCGETRQGNWLALRAYGIGIDEFMERLPAICRQLAAAWKAGAEA